MTSTMFAVKLDRTETTLPHDQVAAEIRKAILGETGTSRADDILLSGSMRMVIEAVKH
jgi:hypothetical protein